MERRAIAAVTILVAVVLVALGVRSCQVSVRNSSLKDYTNNVSSLIRQSDQTGSQLFTELTRGGDFKATALEDQIDQARVSADAELARSRNIGPVGGVQAAQRYLLLALQMRRDAIARIAGLIGPALAASTSIAAFDELATEMGRFFASDVLYNDYTLPVISGALHADGIPIGGVNGVVIESGQVLPNVQWLTPHYVALQLTGRVPRSGKPAPGVHGHRMDSVSVDGTTLQTGMAKTVPDSPAPTFTCSFTNDGQDVETNVVVKVSLVGTSVVGLALVPQTTPGHQATAEVTLNSSPPKGTYTVSATVEQVPGETVLTHNTLTFPVTFQ